MSEHPRAEESFQYLLSSSMITVIPTTSFLEPVLCKLPVRLAQPLGARRIVWKNEKRRQHAQDCDNALDDEQPAEALQSGCPVHMSNPICDCASKSSGKIAKSNH